jgi:hypothetical protein
MAISRMDMERQLRAGGGIMTLEEPRQGYFLGKIVKKAKKAVKKVVKSPIGKLALLGAAGYGLGGGTFFGKSLPFLKAGSGGFSLANLGTNLGLGSLGPAGKFMPNKIGEALLYKDGNFSLGKAGLLGLGATALAAPFFAGDEEVVDEESFTGPISSVESIRDQARQYYGDPTNSALYFMPPKSAVRSSFYAADGGLAREGYRVGGGVMGMLQKAGGAMKNLKNNILTKLGRMTDDVEIQTTYDDAADTGPSMDTMITAKSGKGKQILDQLVAEGVAEVDEGVYYIKDFDEAMMGLQEGGIKASGAKLGTDKFTPIRDFESGPYESVEESMIRNLNKRADGGLMDLGGLEKDYREGGFVPLGAEERADDVPARLSKNEFVFTADAVRNAGQGDIDKGAEVMQNMMDNLEAGGTISEESQGKNPAQAMFDQAQQLESRIA